MKLLTRFRGLLPYRFKDNPLERVFAYAWQRLNAPPHRESFMYMMDLENNGQPNPPLTERDYLVAATVIQWLGSPAGSVWLVEVLHHRAARSLRQRIQGPAE